MKQSHRHLIELVSLLNDHQFHDGDQLGAHLQVTRSAIWKMIKKLISYGIEIESVKGKGYVMREPLILLDPDVIHHHAKNPCEIEVLESVDSTNHYLKSYRQYKSIKCCIAEQQTQGKGRFNREWYSPFGMNIYFSMLYHFQKDISELAGLSLAVSLAIVQTLKQFGAGEQLCVKWPNDILYAGKKLSGTLIELQAESHGVSQAIIGIGINVNAQIASNKNITQPWTSLRNICGNDIDRNVLAASLMDNVLKYLQRFEAHGFADFMDEWAKEDCLLHQAISLHHLKETVSGHVAGVNEQGHLLLKLASGQVHAYSSGEASIQKSRN
jgi:BirA family biotin operon repressor/biotin-[acetyl-CoA-carboxylase] ligase